MCILTIWHTSILYDIQYFVIYTVLKPFFTANSHVNYYWFLVHLCTYTLFVKKKIHLYFVVLYYWVVASQRSCYYLAISQWPWILLITSCGYGYYFILLCCLSLVITFQYSCVWINSFHFINLNTAITPNILSWWSTLRSMLM